MISQFKFYTKHLPVPFYLEGTERRSLRDVIFREVASNMLIHREYASGATSRLIIEYGKVVTDNPSRPHGFGPINFETAVPYQKNPIISAFFRIIDRADELGSGMRKMMLYGKKYGGTDPQLIEGDSFRMVIGIPEFGKNPAEKMKIVQSGAESGAESKRIDGLGNGLGSGLGNGLGSTKDRILEEMAKTPKISGKKLAEILGISATAVEKTIKKLQENGLLKRIGTHRNGHWKIVPANQPSPKRGMEGAGKSSEMGSEMGSEKSSEKIIALLQGNPVLTISALSDALGISTRAIEKNIKKLQENGLLKRVGSNRNGHWEVLK